MTEEKRNSTPVGAGNGVEASTGGALNSKDTTTAPVVEAAEPDPDNIPEVLKALPYWVLYQRREKGGKVTPFDHPKADKIPLRPHPPFLNASTADPTHCDTFGEAREALRQCSQAEGLGLGLVLTHAWMDAPDMVALDFDGLRNPHTGEIAPDKRERWETIKAINSYTEVSPSGEGFRVLCYGTGIETFNHDGVEAYPTGAARFVTVTGAHVESFPREPRRVDKLAEVLEPYRPAAKPEAAGDVSDLPETPPPPPEDVPEASELGLSGHWLRFLKDRDQPPEQYDGDRSRALQGVTTALLRQEREPAEVLAVLESTDAYRLAQEHRGQNETRAREYLWNGVRNAAAHRPGAVAEAKDFPDLGAAEPDGRPPWERGPFPLTRFTDMGSTPMEWLVRGLFPKQGFAQVFGKPASGKSFLAIGLACAVATGRAYCGREVETGPVVYIAGEGHHGIRQRVRAWAAHHGVEDEALDDLFVSKGPANLTHPESVEHVRTGLKEVAAEVGSPRLIVIDTLARCFGGGDENSTKDMNTFVTNSDRLRADWDALVLAVHHTGHHNQDRARGAMALAAALDADYRVSKDPDGTVRATCSKMKDAPEPDPLAFSLEVQDLDTEESSAVLVPTEYTEPPRRGTAGKGERQQEALRLLRELEAFPDEDEDEGVPLTKWREACQARGMPRSTLGDVVKTLTGTGGPVEQFNTGGTDCVRTRS